MPFPLNKDLTPENAPSIPFVPGAGAVKWRELENGYAFLEVFCRSNGSFGFRYQFWVAYRDAGGFIRSHAWRQTDPGVSLATDSLEEACCLAEQSGLTSALVLSGPWQNSV